ncbi:hypothetical protein FQZ97_847490 [compost metagenome]
MATRPISSATTLSAVRRSSSCCSNCRAGPSSTCSGTSSNTLQGLASGIGLKGCSTRSISPCCSSAVSPPLIKGRNSPACSAKALSTDALSRLASRLWPASSAAGLNMLTWP